MRWAGEVLAFGSAGASKSAEIGAEAGAAVRLKADGAVFEVAAAEVDSTAAARGNVSAVAGVFGRRRVQQPAQRSCSQPHAPRMRTQRRQQRSMQTRRGRRSQSAHRSRQQRQRESPPHVRCTCAEVEGRRGVGMGGRGQGARGEGELAGGGRWRRRTLAVASGWQQRQPQHVSSRAALTPTALRPTTAEERPVGSGRGLQQLGGAPTALRPSGNLMALRWQFGTPTALER